MAWYNLFSNHLKKPYPKTCYVCSAQTLAHKPGLRRRDPQKYTYSYHWCFVKVTKLNLGQDSEVRFGQDFKFKFSRDADVWLRFCSWCLIKILKLKFDQDLCKKLWYEFNPWVRSAFGDVFADHLIANISFRQIVKETSQFPRQFQSYSACCSKSDCWKNLAPIWIIWTFSPPV